MGIKFGGCDQVLNKLLKAEVLSNQRTTLAVVWKKIGISDCTYYRWRKEYGDMRIEQAKRLKELEPGNIHQTNWSQYPS